MLLSMDKKMLNQTFVIPQKLTGFSDDVVDALPVHPHVEKHMESVEADNKKERFHH
jgi:hypothetical protein